MTRKDDGLVDSLTINTMRLLPLTMLLAVIACLLSPFLLTVWLRERYGAEITGRVTFKQERVWHSTFENDITRSTAVTVSYFPPGRSWPAYQTVTLPLARYDAIHRGDVLEMRYLLERDLPDYPLLHSLYRSGFLPVASVDGRSLFTIYRDLSTRLPVRILWGATAVIAVLWLWYKLRIPGRSIGIVVCIFIALGAIVYSEIPRSMPPLQGDLLSGTATVQNQWTIDKVFVSRNSSSSITLDKAVQYISFEFVPEGRRESVVAADNIDAGSIPKLTAGQAQAIQYERNNPRNARLVAGTRTFWSKNLRGLAITAVAWIVMGGLALVLWERISRGRPGSGKTLRSA